MKPRTARAVPICWELLCPHCEETIPAPRGSLYWTVTDTIEEAECPGCGEDVRLPQALQPPASPRLSPEDYGD